MHIGHTIVQGSSSTDLFSPWFPREADNAVFTYEQIKLESSSFTVEVWHKNTEDLGDGTQLTGTFTADSTFSNIYYHTFEGLKELVRFRYELNSGDWEVGGPCFVIYRMLAPTWFNTENAS